MMTTIESIVPGGLGRSYIQFVPTWKGKKEVGIENLFSLTRVNFSNIRANEEATLRCLKDFSADGWEFLQTMPLAQALNGTGGQTTQGGFMTCYLLRNVQATQAPR